MEAAFCVEALEEALARYGTPEIIQHGSGQPVHRRGVYRRAARQRHRDQHGRQGSFGATTCSSSGYGGRSSTRKSIACYDTPSEARASLGRYIAFYNSRRPHSSLDRQTPDKAYFNRLPHLAAA